MESHLPKQTISHFSCLFSFFFLLVSLIAHILSELLVNLFHCRAFCFLYHLLTWTTTLNFSWYCHKLTSKHFFFYYFSSSSELCLKLSIYIYRLYRKFKLKSHLPTFVQTIVSSNQIPTYPYMFTLTCKFLITLKIQFYLKCSWLSPVNLRPNYVRLTWNSHAFAVPEMIMTVLVGTSFLYRSYL